MDTFLLQKLPPNIDCESKQILQAANKASRALGQLKGEISKIPNSQILIDTLSLQEAKDSNEIENIVTTHDEMFQAVVDKTTTPSAAKEAINYANAIKLGLTMVDKDLLTINNIKSLQHQIAPKHPIRKMPGTTLKNPATGKTVYTPPQDFRYVEELLNNLEFYINDDKLHDIDPLIKMPIIHYQFESIHPFYDGNGRTGRLINILYLVKQELLTVPVLYLSSYIIKDKATYYSLLQKVREENAWEEWIIWMLKGVEETAKDTIIVVNKIKKLMDEYKSIIKNDFPFYSHDLINVLFRHPYTKTDFLEKELTIHRQTASKYLNQLSKKGLLIKVKIGRANYYVNSKLLDILIER